MKEFIYASWLEFIGLLELLEFIEFIELLELLELLEFIGLLELVGFLGLFELRMQIFNKSRIHFGDNFSLIVNTIKVILSYIFLV